MCDVSLIGPAVSLAGSLFGGDSGGGNGSQQVSQASGAQEALLGTQNRLLNTQVNEYESPEAIALRKKQIDDASANIDRRATDYDTLAANRKAASQIATRINSPDYVQQQVDAASSDAAAAGDATDANQAATMRSMGLDPSSPAAIAARAGAGTARTLGVVQARNTARRNAIKDALAANVQVGQMQRGTVSDTSSATTVPSTSGVQSSINGLAGLGQTAANMNAANYNMQAQQAASLGGLAQGIGKVLGSNSGTPPINPSYGFTNDYGMADVGLGWAKGGEVRRPRTLGMVKRNGKYCYAEGGEVSGPGGPTDDAVPAVIDGDTPAALSDGEYVINAHSTQNVYGPRTLDSVNRGTALVIPEHELAHIGRSQVRRLLAGSRRMEV